MTDFPWINVESIPTICNQKFTLADQLFGWIVSGGIAVSFFPQVINVLLYALTGRDGVIMWWFCGVVVNV